MTTTNSATGSISSAGIGSGLDVKGIISSLMAVEAQPLTLLQDKATTVSTEISAVGQIQSLTSALGDKAQALSSLSLWTQTTATSADASAVAADTSTGTAAAGDYSVSVQQLAQGQTVTSGALSSSSGTFSAGTLTIQLGTYTTVAGTPPTTTFANKSGVSAISVTIGSGDTSLASVRDKINAAKAGVSASIITDATGSRLSLRSTDTGAENGFQISATEAVDDGNAATGLSALSYDGTGAGASQLTLNQSSQNAKASVNGIAVESASNKLSNISDGLTLNLLKVSTTPVDVTVAADTAAMQKAITDFVTAYSALNANILSATKYDTSSAVKPGTSRKDGPLEGDPSILGFQNQLRAIVNTTSTTSTLYARLSDIGITVQTDGSLATNATKLTAALANPLELQKLFATQGSTAATTGIAVRFSNLSDAALAPDGSLASRNDGLKGELSRNSKQQDDMQTHLDATQARLTAQYQALDTTMSKMNALSSYVTQQVALMQKA